MAVNQVSAVLAANVLEHATRPRNAHISLNVHLKTFFVTQNALLMMNVLATRNAIQMDIV